LSCGLFFCVFVCVYEKSDEIVMVCRLDS